MTTETKAAPVVEDYLKFARALDQEGANAYLKEHFVNEDGVSDKKGMEEFIEKVLLAAEAESIEDNSKVEDSTEEEAAPVVVKEEVETNDTTAQVQEAPSESEASD